MRSHAPVPAFRLRSTLQMLLLILAIAWHPVAAIANDATPEAMAPLPEPTAVVVQPTPEPLPTEAPPTALPTIPPPPETPIPIPTETMPAAEPTADPSPTPEQPEATLATGPGDPDGLDAASGETPPTQQASTPEPPATPGDTPPTAEPTPAPEPNTDSVTPLSPMDSVMLDPGATSTIEITYAVTTVRIATIVQIELRNADGTLATGWTLTFQPGEAPNAPAAEMTDSTALGPGTSFTFGIMVQAPAAVDEAHAVTLHIRSVESNASDERVALTGESPITTLTMAPLTPDADDDLDEPQATDLSLSCASDGAASATSDEPVNVSCSFRGNESLADREVTLSRVSVSLPEGWALAAPQAQDDPSVIAEPRSVLGSGEEYAVDFAVLPSVCNANPGPVSVRSTLLPGEGSDEAIEGPAATLQLEILPAPALPPGVDISALSFGTSERSDNGYAPVSGTLAITVAGPAPPRCGSVTSGWSIQVGTNGLSGSDRSDAGIPAESITYLGTQSVETAPKGILPVDADIALATGGMTTIAHGDASIGKGGTWNAMFLLTPPSDLPGGTYEGEINVTIINGP